MITTIPLVDPPNTVRASKLSDCYRITSFPTDIQYDHLVGKAVSFVPKTFTIYNTTVGHRLRVSLSMPSFMMSNLGNQFILTAQETKVIIISFDESNIKSKTMTGTRKFTENISITIEPLDVSGPIHVKTI